MVTSNRGSQQFDSQSTAGQPRYATFNSTKVLICGYPEKELSTLCQSVEQEGGKVIKKYYKGSRPDVIVCGTVADRHCKEARRAWQDAVPVVTSAWVEACTKQKAQVDVGPYKLGALVGLEISATNFCARKRAVLQQLVEQAGGTYSAELHKGRTTHLICKNGTGKKHKAAVQWRSVHVVSDTWLNDSAQLGYPAPENNYKVDPVLDAIAVDTADAAAGPAAVAAAAAPQPHTVSQSVMFGNNSSKQASTAATNKQQQQAELEPGLQEASSRASGKQTAASTAAAAAVAAAAAAAIEQQVNSRTRSRSQRLSQQPPPAAEQQQQQAAAQPEGTDPADAAPAAADTSAAVHVNSTDARLAALGVTDADAAPMFLERVVLYWCGIPEGSSEHFELQTILHAYAGIRFPDIQDITTHIVVGLHAKIEELKAVQAYVKSCNRRVEVVGPAWLELCHQEQRLVPPDARCRMALSSLMQRAAAAAAGPSGTLGAAAAAGVGPAGGIGANGGLRSVGSSGVGGGGGVFANTASRGGFPGDAAEQQEAACAPEYWHEKPADPLKIFEGCFFTLAAVQSHQADHEKALALIRRLGGKVFTADSTKPPVRWPKVFAVCPASLPREAEAALTAADASFRLVHPSCRVTTYWMDRCVKSCELVRVSARNPLLAPLRCALPLRDFANVTIAVTGYKEVQRSTIEKLVVLLGGTFCKTLGRQQRATHLMLPRWGPDALASAAAAAAHGSASLPDSTVKKIAYAMKHGLEMVVSEWLLDCAAEGRRVQEGLHRPDGDVNLLEFPVGAGATQGAGLTQLPVTQLQQTQAQAMPPAVRQGSSSAAAAAAAAGQGAPGPSNQGTRSLASLFGGPASLPRPPPAASKVPAASIPPAASKPGGDSSSSSLAGAQGSDAANAAAAAAATAPRSSWFTANRFGSSTRTSTQQPAGNAAAAPVEQQGQQQDVAQLAAGTAVSPQKSAGSSRKRSAAALGTSTAAATAAAVPGSSQQDRSAAAAALQDHQEQQQDTSQQAKRQCKPQESQQLGSRVQQQAAAAGTDGAGPSSTAAEQPAAAAAAAEAGTEGHDAALTGVLSMLADFGRDPIPASQAMAGDILPDSLLSAGRVASAGCGSGPGAGGSGGGGLGSAGVSGGQGSRLRSTRRAGGLGRASSGGAGSSGGPGAGGETLDSMGVGGGGGSEQGGSMGGSTAVQPGAKRQRRTSTRGKAAPGNAAAAAGDAAAQTGSGSSAGAAMLPPSRKAAGAAGGRAAAAAGAQPAAGSGVYGTRRSYAVPTDVAFEPSQQVGYDVGDTPETLLAAAAAGAGPRGPRRSADDAKKQAHMLARLSSLRSRASS